jgi:hypothetical protein
LELYANGVRFRDERIDHPSGAVEKTRVRWSIPRPAHDQHLVAIASGPGVSALYWPIQRPYQPTSRVWEPRVLAATNPVWLDADGDGTYSSPRAIAAKLIRATGTAPERIIPALAGCDQAVAAQAARLCQTAGVDVRSAEFSRILATAREPIKRGFDQFAHTLASP